MSHKVMVAIVGGWLLAGVGAGWAYPLEDVRVEWWTGSGAHQVLLVVDFWPGNAQVDSFAFGYRFDADQISGTQLLAAVQEAGRGFSFAAGGGFVTDIWYVRGSTTYHRTYDCPVSYWAYWESGDYGETWEYAMTGSNDRVLRDGDTDGWLTLTCDDWTTEPVTPLVQTMAGDLNCDGLFNFRDINPFVLALTNPSAYAQTFPGCPILQGDINDDGSVNFRDINPFVALMLIDP